MKEFKNGIVHSVGKTFHAELISHKRIQFKLCSQFIQKLQLNISHKINKINSFLQVHKPQQTINK